MTIEKKILQDLEKGPNICDHDRCLHLKIFSHSTGVQAVINDTDSVATNHFPLVYISSLFYYLTS